MKKVYILILFVFLTGCDSDPFDAGIVSNIHGTVSDFSENKPFVDLKLKVAEYKRDGGFYTSYKFIKWIDSTYTDINGFYSLDFKTSGQGDHYRLFVEEDVNIWTYFYDAIEIDSIGKSNRQDLDFLHLYPTNLVIDLNNLDFLPILIDVYPFDDLEDIQSNNGTIERLLYSNKNSDTEITFRRKNANNEYESYTIVVPASYTSDLTTFNLTLSNSDFN